MRRGGKVTPPNLWRTWAQEYRQLNFPCLLALNLSKRMFCFYHFSFQTILFEVRARWRWKNLAGSENPKNFLGFFLRAELWYLAGWCRKLAGSENPKKILGFFLRVLMHMQKIGGIWKPKINFRILFEGGARWLMQKIGGIWKPKKNFRILFEGALASWLMQKIGGIWKPKKKFRILFEGAYAHAENWRDLTTQKKFRILFEGATTRWLISHCK